MLCCFSATTNWLEELDVSWNHLRQRGAIGMAKGLEVMSIFSLLHKHISMYGVSMFLFDKHNGQGHVHILYHFILESDASLSTCKQ